MRKLVFCFVAFPSFAFAQPAPDPVAQAAYATASDLMTALISTRAEVLGCRADLAKLQKEKTATEPQK